jgi:UDP-MurNAc hydroxylase
MLQGRSPPLGGDHNRVAEKHFLSETGCHIRFFNHACYSVSNTRSTLISDPYLFGTAFNEGWDLIWRDVRYEGLDQVTHIWYSHEHPDHFSPRFLFSIPSEKRPDITVLYQETRDKRIINFCKRLGFRTIELSHLTPYRIDEQFEITCGKVPLYDSWSLIRAGNVRLLNLNDCNLDREEEITGIAKLFPEPDVLLTQFSYASWLGNPDESPVRRENAAHLLRRIVLQCEIVRPAFIIPIASYVFFSHEENFYANDCINTPWSVAELIEKDCHALPVIMVPNEIWDCRTPRRNGAALSSWRKAYGDALAKPIHVGKLVSEEELTKECDRFLRRMFQTNSHTIIRLLTIFRILPAIAFYVWDLRKGFYFSWNHGLTADSWMIEANADISLGSESLHFLFSHDFGADTLNVNARFRGTDAAKKKLNRVFAVPSLNNTGRSLNFSMAKLLAEPKFLERGLQTVGLWY